jgi:HPt (histidine-containing phosphotransfer) domain-containing protein
MTSDSLSELMSRLRRDYMSEMPARLADLRRTASSWIAGGEPEPPLATLFHRLAGSAGAYGYTDVSTICRAGERLMSTMPGRTTETAARLEAAIRGVEEAFARGPTGPDITA